MTSLASNITEGNVKTFVACGRPDPRATIKLPDSTSNYVMEIFACNHDPDGQRSYGIHYQLDDKSPKDLGCPGVTQMDFHAAEVISNAAQVQIWGGGDNYNRNGTMTYVIYQI